MSCYFHQNLAFIAFKSADQMQSVCQLRLYTEDDRLLTGRPCFLSKQKLSQTPLINNLTSNHEVMSSHTNDLPDLNSKDTPSKCPHTPHRSSSPTNPNKQPYKTRKLTYNHTNHYRDNESSLLSQDPSITNKKDFTVNTLLSQPSHVPSSSPDASLELILAKLNELDAIKTHLNVLDYRLDNL